MGHTDFVADLLNLFMQLSSVSVSKTLCKLNPPVQTINTLFQSSRKYILISSAACLQQFSMSLESFFNVRKTIVAKTNQSKTMQLMKTQSQNVSLESLALGSANSHVSPKPPDPLISVASVPVEIPDSRPRKRSHPQDCFCDLLEVLL